MECKELKKSSKNVIAKEIKIKGHFEKRKDKNNKERKLKVIFFERLMNFILLKVSIDIEKYISYFSNLDFVKTFNNNSKEIR